MSDDPRVASEVARLLHRESNAAFAEAMSADTPKERDVLKTVGHRLKRIAIKLRMELAENVRVGSAERV
jgi:hypothetical protein